MTCYYNDSEPFVAEWLRNLIAAGHLPAGDVDERPIQEVEPDDVRGYAQCHFFAGIGGWAYALQLAGWGDRPVWTGSCPCQPFSSAGKGQAEDDARHLWPHWFRLIRECKPRRVFGEQVANAAGHGWFDVVSTDLEAEAYTVGAVVLGAHSVGAPHIRQRLWFVADRDSTRCGTWRAEQAGDGRDAPRVESAGLRLAGKSDNTASPRRNGEGQRSKGKARDETRLRGSECGCSVSELADAERTGRSERRSKSGDGSPPSSSESGELADAECGRCKATDLSIRSARQDQATTVERRATPWEGYELISCRDGKARPTQPGILPLVDGISYSRMAVLRAAGNAIVPQVAAEFVKAYMEISVNPALETVAEGTGR